MGYPSYEVIARRWRPKQFNEIVGQDHIVKTLLNAIKLNRMAHAYLFIGPRGTGKTTTARIFAKALNAEGGPNPTPNDSSNTAQAIMNGSCMDVIEIDGASNNSVDQIRDLRDDCQYSPTECTFKIYIIDEVHMLTTAAFNALLKTLEEPPPHVKFIFATTEAHKVLPTIVSRCQRLEFRPISDSVIAQKLNDIANAEKLDIEPHVFTLIARLAKGGMRDAQSILDQLISFCGNTIKESDVTEVYGLVSEEFTRSLLKAMILADYQKIIALTETLSQEGRDFYRIIEELEVLTHKALIHAIKNNGITKIESQNISRDALMRLLDALQKGKESIKTGLSEQVNFEITLLRAVEASRLRAIDTLLKQISEHSPTPPPLTAHEDQKKNLSLSTCNDSLDNPISLCPPDPIPDSSIFNKTSLPESNPSLTTALNEIPQSTQKLLDELFRVQYLYVKELKTNESPEVTSH